MSAALDVEGDHAWLLSAACRGKATSWWFADGRTFEAAVALAICRTCPVRSSCLAAALAEEAGELGGGLHGIRGGLTVSERQRLNTEARRGGRAEAAAAQLLSAIADTPAPPTEPVFVRWHGSVLGVAE